MSNPSSLRSCGLALAGLLLSVSVASAGPELDGIRAILGPAPQSADRFGWDVAIDGETLVVGAPFHDAPEFDDGAVFIYKHSPPHGWVHVQTLTMDDSVFTHRFGFSVDVEGDTLVVGSPNAAGNGGAIWIFERIAGVWEIKHIYPNPDTDPYSDQFGDHVDISGNTILVTAWGDDPYGSVSTYNRDATGSWVFHEKLSPQTPILAGSYGISAAIDGNTIVVGAHRGNVVDVWSRINGTWVPATQLLPPGDSRRFGTGVGIGGDVVAVGDLWFDEGKAYAFRRVGNAWVYEQELVPSATPWVHQYGKDFAIEGDRIVVGADPFNVQGRANVFDWDGSTWTETRVMTSILHRGSAGDDFGKSVAISGGVVAVGSGDNYISDEYPRQTGVAYVFYDRDPADNLPPVAGAGADFTIECLADAAAPVDLDGSDSIDPDSAPFDYDIVKYEWFVNYGQPEQALIGTGPSVQLSRPLGSTLVTLRVEDYFGLTSADDVLVTVADTVPPTVALDVDPGQLWPPNHRMVEVLADVTAEDACQDPSVVLASIASDEPDNAGHGGDGDTVNDIQQADYGTDDRRFLLRAERLGGGDGRLYTVRFEAVDPSGNLASAPVLVAVPHDQGGIDEPLMLELVENASGTVVQWPAMPGTDHYNVVRGYVDEMADVGNAIDLGPVVCVETVSVDASTVGSEDAAKPEPGRVFFYVAEAVTGTDSTSFGTVSAVKPRIAPAACQ